MLIRIFGVSKVERVDDLEFNGLKIFQDDELYCFTIDSILLVNLSKIKRDAVVVDLCSGCGIVPILVAGKSMAKEIYAFELQERLANLAKKSVQFNGLDDKVKIINDEIKNYANYSLKNKVDVVYCNPPYSKKESAIIGDNESRNIARLELTTNLGEVVDVASGLLKPNGVFYMVHDAKRLQEIMAKLSLCKLAVKELTFIKGKEQDCPHLIFIKAVKCGKEECKIHLPIVLNGENGELSDAVKCLYSKKSI